MTSPYSKLPPDKQFFDLSLWPEPVATAFVGAFHKIPVRPEWFVLMALISGVALAITLLNDDLHKGIVIFLIFFRTLFDVIDGMWARATHTVTPLGGLLDLSADIVSNTLLFASLGVSFYRATHSVLSLPLTFLACLITHFTMTFYSLNLFFHQQDYKAPASRFIEGDFQGAPPIRFQKLLLPPLRFLYRLSWRAFAVTVFYGMRRILGYGPCGPARPLNSRFLSLLSIFGLCSHYLYLAVCVVIFKPYDLIYVELGLGLIFLLILTGFKFSDFGPCSAEKTRRY